MVKAIVFFDLDGTLLQPDKTVSQECVQAMVGLRQQDILPVIATGRNRFEINYVLQATGIDTLVAANGAAVFDHGELVQQATIDPATVSQLSAFATRRGDPVGWYDQTGFALSEENADTQLNYSRLGLHPHVDGTWTAKRAINFMFVFTKDAEDTYQQAFGAKLSMVRNNPLGLDVMPSGITKKAGIQQLLARIGAAVPTYAFGDQANDLPMFASVLHPIAMGNAADAAKANAEYVTTANTDHGIVRGLHHFQLL